MKFEADIIKIHASMVSGLKKDGELILETLTPEQVDLWHMVTGVVGEAGELIDAVKKHIIYNRDMDLENVVEEMGDLEFYLEGIRQNLNLDRDDILQFNYDKLVGGDKPRYKHGRYSDRAAQERADKQ